MTNFPVVEGGKRLRAAQISPPSFPTTTRYYADFSSLAGPYAGARVRLVL